MSEVELKPAELELLLSPAGIRERAREIFELTLNGKTNFVYHSEQLGPASDFVAQVIREKYPDGHIPVHSRWGHFRAGGRDRVREFDRRLEGMKPLERARANIDLIVTSVLLDAGAGEAWSFVEKSSGQKFSRSEGLGVASFHMFCGGAMSSDPKIPQADAKGLRQLSAASLRESFQVSEQNPLLGVEGRILLLHNLAAAVENKKIFRTARPGALIDYLGEKFGDKVPAAGILRAVLDGFGAIWPGRLTCNGVNLGDVWRYKDNLVPLHKLSQWMTYSLLEPIEDARFKVTGVEELTGLAEYRNGGLMLDSGLLTLKNPVDAEKEWTPDSELIIEWRALTIHLLDLMGAHLKLPLPKLLEGGTWWAGRKLAQQKRQGAGPPLKIKSDGTVF